MTHRVTILDAIADPNLFAPWFKKRETWAAWRAFLAALFALPMSDEQLAIYRDCTGRAAPPTDTAREAWLVIGRRGGKSFVLALIAVFLAAFFDYRKHLAPGERATVLVIATNTRQARVIMRFVRALLTRVPMLSQMIERESAEGFDLSNDTTIEVHAASFRSTRGYTIVAALCDEIAFWPTDDCAEPDREIINALRPGMATIPSAMLLCASSPYARRGALWDAHRRHFGKDGDPILVWQAPTRTMNPTVPQGVIDEAVERDPASAQAEYLAQFRTDVEAFITREAVEGCVSIGLRERPPIPTSLTYSAFVDPSGGSADAMTLAIGHRESDGHAILDCVRERRPPFSPEAVVDDYCTLLKSYQVSQVTGDRYAGEWPREQFAKRGVEYVLADKTRSELYRDLLPQINSRRVDLLDNERLLTQLVGLERRTGRGRDLIDHAPGAHDDLANAVAGVVNNLLGAVGTYDSTMSWVRDYAPTRRERAMQKLRDIINGEGATQ